MRKLCLLLLASVALTMHAKETTVKSPDGRVAVTIADERGLVTYSVTYAGQTFLKTSSLGLSCQLNF